MIALAGLDATAGGRQAAGGSERGFAGGSTQGHPIDSTPED